LTKNIVDKNIFKSIVLSVSIINMTPIICYPLIAIVRNIFYAELMNTKIFDTIMSALAWYDLFASWYVSAVNCVVCVVMLCMAGRKRQNQMKRVYAALVISLLPVVINLLMAIFVWRYM
jgi:hypothetical protein